MKFYSPLLAACCLSISSHVFSDFQLSASLSSPYSEGTVGFVSDISSDESAQQAFEDVGLYKDSVVTYVNWMGSEIPTASNSTPLKFKISFHEELLRIPAIVNTHSGSW